MDPVTIDAATHACLRSLIAQCPTTPTSLALDLRWWAAANYLTAGQIYLRDNALLRGPQHGMSAPCSTG